MQQQIHWVDEWHQLVSSNHAADTTEVSERNSKADLQVCCMQGTQLEVLSVICFNQYWSIAYNFIMLSWFRNGLPQFSTPTKTTGRSPTPPIGKAKGKDHDWHKKKLLEIWMKKQAKNKQTLNGKTSNDREYKKINYWCRKTQIITDNTGCLPPPTEHLLPGKQPLSPAPSNHVRWNSITVSWPCPLLSTAKINPGLHQDII